MDEQLKAADAAGKELKEKKKELEELDTRIAEAGPRYQLLEAFLGLVGARTAAEVEEFLNLAPMLINEAKSGKYAPDFLTDFIIGKLAGGALDLIACKACGARFVMVRRGQQQYPAGKKVSAGVPERCPDCLGFHTLSVEKSLAITLKEKLGPEKIIVVQKSIMIKPGKITPEGKSEGAG